MTSLHARPQSRRFLVAVVATLAAAGATYTWVSQQESKEPMLMVGGSAADEAVLDEGLREVLEEAGRTGMMPVGVRDGGPYGWARTADLEAASDPAFDLPVYDEGGALIAYGIDSYGIVDLDVYADDDAMRAIRAEAGEVRAARATLTHHVAP